MDTKDRIIKGCQFILHFEEKWGTETMRKALLRMADLCTIAANGTSSEDFDPVKYQEQVNTQV
jgi:hypothetical protein